MEEAIKIIFDEEIFITDKVTGDDGEVCEIDISTCDYDNSTFMLFLTREQVEQTIKALQNIISQDVR